MRGIFRIKQLQLYFGIGFVWLLFWIFSALLNNPEKFLQHSLNEIWRFIFITIANLIFFEYSLPLILKKRSFILFTILNGIFLIAAHLFLLSFGLVAWKFLGIQLHIYTSFRQATLIPDGLYNKIMDEAAYQAQGGVSSFFFFGIAKLFHHNFKLRQTTQKLRLEKQEAELNYLKSQMNPHFLFNTLNNIYALAKDKSELAPESILRLSKILRFMLYETGGKFISIEQELDIINDYIALEKLRYDDSLQIILKYEIEDKKIPLPPLLLIPLVENAFKHGVSETRNLPFVNIQLSVKKQRLLFVVKNSVEDFQGERNVKENIGLSNLRRQLELLYSDYQLFTQQIQKMFTATLIINLSSNVKN